MNGKSKYIAFIVRNTDFGGINSVTLELVKEMKNIENVNPIVFSLSKSKNNVFSDCEVYYFDGFLNGFVGYLNKVFNKLLPLLGGFLLKFYFLRKLELELTKFDSIEKVFLCGFGVYNFFPRVNNHKFYYVSHSIKSKMLKQRNKLTYRLSIMLLRKAVELDKLIVVSDAIKRDWVENININESNIYKRIYNPINCKRVQDLSHEVKFDDYEKYFVFCGRLSVEKNIFSIINSFIDSDTDCPLLLVGDGPLKGDITKYIASENLESKIKLIGALRNPYPLIRSAQALILFSHYEGLPTVALEAICLNVNLIIGECGGAAFDVIDESQHDGIIINNNMQYLKIAIGMVSSGKEIKFNLKTDFLPPQVVMQYLQD
ncbi:MAG: glycosyltransferase [Algicola sp.]|nr:glycosyltransferase [Algicola sp.]